MKVQDLMIGNLVCISKRKAKVVEIRKELVGVEFLDDNGFDVFKPDDLLPIELTAEMLVANGFGGDNPDDYYGEEMNLQLDFNGWPIEEQEGGWGWNGTVSGYGTQIKYVHQLQNALTNCGRKIEFKLESAQ